MASKKKGGLLGSAFGAVAKTAKMAASTATNTASNTAKLGVKVASNTATIGVNLASKTTQIAVNTATEGVKLTGLAVQQSGQHVMSLTSGDFLATGASEGNAAREQRAHQPVQSISALAGGVLGGSSAAIDFNLDDSADPDPDP